MDTRLQWTLCLTNGPSSPSWAFLTLSRVQDSGAVLPWAKKARNILWDTPLHMMGRQHLHILCIRTLWKLSFSSRRALLLYFLTYIRCMHRHITTLFILNFLCKSRTYVLLSFSVSLDVDRLLTWHRFAWQVCFLIVIGSHLLYFNSKSSASHVKVCN